MSNVAKLKKQAAEFELKKQFDKALAIYVKMLESFDPNDAELDVALFNRVGDLMLRQGNVADAVDYYERAVDHYSETGFFNNAIALCNKILRHSPGRASVYYKLGKISAQKGFGKDAKVNFLEYADRMQKAGKVDEAFRALTEFADLCPDQDEIRLMLADQLTKAGRKDDAVEQLQILHERYDGDGHTAEAAATATRMRAIDPKVEPRAAASGRRKTTSGELVFIDLDAPSLSRPRSMTPAPARPVAPEPKPGELSFIIPTPEPPEGVPQVADPRLETKTPEEPLSTRVTPVVEQPVPEEPAVEELEVQEQVLEVAASHQSVIDEPVIEEPESLLEDAAIDEPVFERSLLEEPMLEEPAIEIAAPAHDIATPVVAAEPVFEAAAPVEQAPVDAPQYEPAEFKATEFDEPRFEEHPIGERLLAEELLADEPDITFAAEALAAEAAEATAFSDPEPESFASDEATPMDSVRFTDLDVGIAADTTDAPSSYLSRLTDPGFDAVEPRMEPPPTIDRLTDPDFDAVRPTPDLPLQDPALRAAQATEYDRTATPAFVLDDPLGEMPNADISRLVDTDIGIIKSTPSAPLLTMGSAIEEESAPLTPTPTSLAGFEPTALGGGSPLEPSLEESEEQLRASIEGAAANGALSAADDDLNLILPDAIQAPKTPESIDLDLSQMITPPAPSRPTPNSTRAALEGLPLMDIDVPRATGAPRTLPGGELELVEQPLRIPPGISNPTPAFGIDGDTESLTIDGVRIAMPTPSSTRKATLVAAQAVTALKKSLEDEPENWGLHRQLAEAMLEAGDRYGGISELELAMAGAERSHDLELASSLAEEIARLEPDSVKHHQKRVEFAFLTNDRSRLIEAYVALADALLRGDQQGKARVVYQRVLDLAPDEIRARAALDTIPVATPESSPPVSRSSSAQRQSSKTSAPAKSSASSDASFVNLGDWLRDTQAPKDTRMVVEEQEPTGDEQADFADMLRKFKQGVAENVDAEDYQSHYDLAIAFKEMGLLDEAIAQFQKALGSPTNRLPTYEALGQCFMEKLQFKLASSILGRALNERASEEKLVGVLYLLGRAAEAQGNAGDAMGYYQRVFVQDIQFRDVADRLSSLESAAR